MSFLRVPPVAISCRSVFLCAFFAAGCHALKLDHPATEKLTGGPRENTLATPGKFTFRLSQYVFHSDFEINKELPLFRELGNLADQVYKELKLPSSTTLVHVYMFEDRDKYESFMKTAYPYLPRRRAFFVAQPHGMGGEEDLIVYTYWGDRVREDLRHELTHALLHSVLKDVPLWLDEGLAEYFELPPDWQGVNYQHLDLLCHGPNGPIKPDLSRLEQFSQVAQMTPAEYREAWGWVHLLLREKPEGRAVLLAYLQQMRYTDKPGLLGPKLLASYPNLEDALTLHLAQLDAGTRPLPNTAKR